jgi:hypothetical protein
MKINLAQQMRCGEQMRREQVGGGVGVGEQVNWEWNPMCANLFLILDPIIHTEKVPLLIAHLSFCLFVDCSLLASV